MRTLALLIASSVVSVASAAPAGYFDLRTGVTLESGNSWTEGGLRYDLYGVQACLRGTFYTDLAERRKDCGDASLAVLSALIRDTKPVCAALARISGTVYVVCYSTVGPDRLDLGNLMITSGFAFAALAPNGLPYNRAYAVAEQLAREEKAGLWRFKDVQHPGILLGRTMVPGASR